MPLHAPREVVGTPTEELDTQPEREAIGHPADVVHRERLCLGGAGIDGTGHAAAKLGLNPSTLRSRMAKLRITRPARPAEPGR